MKKVVILIGVYLPSLYAAQVAEDSLFSMQSYRGVLGGESLRWAVRNLHALCAYNSQKVEKEPVEELHRKRLVSLNSLLDQCPINAVDDEGKSVLFLACQEGNQVQLIEYLINRGAFILLQELGKAPAHALAGPSVNEIVRDRLLAQHRAALAAQPQVRELLEKRLFTQRIE